MLRKVRILLACLFGLGLTWLFLDFTGIAHRYLGWMAKLQFLPALLALNVVVVVVLLLLTWLLGRVYCSVICPLGILQDVFAHFGLKAKRNRYQYRKPLTWLRYGVLALFVVLMLIPGTGVIANLIAPYSAFGRICSSLLAPLYAWGNNLLAALAERMDSYAFYETDVWVKSVATLTVAVVTLVLLAVLSWREGRIWCNSICPVGTLLGTVSRFSLLKIRIDDDKCNRCGLCARNCKSSCIDAKTHQIDYSRCVGCMNCIERCHQKAISLGRAKKSAVVAVETAPDASRRGFLAVGAVLAADAVMAQKKKIDGGLAVIADKRIPERQTPVKPVGAQSLRHFSAHCTACQLCVSACPNGVLRPSRDLGSLMQPEMSFERGWCRPECVRCSQACPTGAIRPVTVEDKSAVSVGYAVYVPENCIVNTDGVP
ncbi:MAG: 4Fe-4S binding protein, partial [Paludibacteraceae bacterium]|nr:4Fe-4S binding protein [Paludibacteraceae bacterium]